MYGDLPDDTCYIFEAANNETGISTCVRNRD